MNVLTRMRLFALAAILLAPLSACALSGGPIDGKVVEEGTNKPIANAIVVARWNGHAFSFADTRTVCVHVLTATTDENGNYSFPLWFKESPIKGVHSIRPTVIAHKHGYGLADEYPNNNPYLKPFAGTRGERLKYLSRTSGATRCGESGDSKKNLLPLYRALYEEAKSIVNTATEEKKITEFLLYELEIVELGYEQATKRHLERPGY